MFLVLILHASSFRWWWRVPVRRKYDDFKTRTIYAFVVTIIKTIFILLVIMWYIRVKNLSNPQDTYTSPLITRAIPPGIWPDANTCLQSWSNQSGDGKAAPAWARCNRSKMFRNGTFVVDFDGGPGSWTSWGKGLGANVLDFLTQPDLFCMTDLTDILFVILFYSLLISYFWDMCYYVIRIFVNPDECNSSNYVITRRSDELHEERIRLKSNDVNENEGAMDATHEPVPVSHI